ncbi:MAG TPA: hypothetical protein VGP72_09695 [Planctomycetota bacterium]|jgi:hypothetical protein
MRPYLLLVFLCTAIFSAESRFDFPLERPAPTSAGIYDEKHRLVRVLWTMVEKQAGTHSAEWDGKDDLGQEVVGRASVPAEKYTFKVVANYAKYENVGAIGNSGLPANAANHTPTNMESVAVDSTGAIYTANWWDEAGADFKKWDADGKSVYDAKYQIRNGKPNGAPYAIAVDEEHIYCTMGGWAREPNNAKAQIQKFTLKDGKHVKFTKVPDPAGHIQLYEWPGKQMPPNTPEWERDYYERPLRAIAVMGEHIFVADYLGNRIVRFNKETGEAAGEFKVSKPVALAVGPANRVWIGHDHRKLKVLTVGHQNEDMREMAEAWLLKEPEDEGRIEAIAFAPDGKLMIADSETGEVEICKIGRSELVLGRKGPDGKSGRRYELIDHARVVSTLGQKARPGDRAPDRFFRLRGVACDKDGNIITIQTEPLGGARLAKWSPDKKLLWEHFGAEFVSLGNYGGSDPETFYSFSFHRYKLKDHKTGQWEMDANCYSPVGRASLPAQAGDKAGAEMAGTEARPTPRYASDPHGALRVLKIDGHDFVYMPTGDGVQIYRVDGKVLRLCSMIGGNDPAPDGSRKNKGPLAQWSWSDADGSGTPKPEDIRYFKKPGEAKYAVFGMDVEWSSGSILFGELHSKAIWEIPRGPLDKKGNPTYDWADAKIVVPRDTSPLKFEPQMAQMGDGIYSFGWSAPWPQPKNNPFWMGGTTLAKFGPNGEREWAVKLPEVCVGLDAVPNGCFVGSGKSAKIYHYTHDGLLVGVLSPGEAMCKESGWMDNHASVAVSRNPKDKILDIFAEDDYVLRIGWYRVDDMNMKTISGEIKFP